MTGALTPRSGRHAAVSQPGDAARAAYVQASTPLALKAGRCCAKELGALVSRELIEAAQFKRIAGCPIRER